MSANVDIGFPKKTCANAKIESGSRCQAERDAFRASRRDGKRVVGLLRADQAME